VGERTTTSRVVWFPPSSMHPQTLYVSKSRIYGGKSERKLSPLTRSSRRGRKTDRVIVGVGGLRTADYTVRPLRRPQSRSQVPVKDRTVVSIAMEL